MSSPRLVLAGLLCAVVAALLVFAWRGSEAAAPGSPSRRPASDPHAEALKAATADGAQLTTASVSARKLGIARSSFGDVATDGKSAPEADLSRGERKLLEKFKHGNLSRIGNATVFMSPDAGTLPGPDPATATSGGGK